MIADKENPAPNHEAVLEEEESLQSSSAPTVLDLRAALKDMFTDVEAELNLNSPDEGFPQRPD
jgi:hypothetical protein